jgi:tetratricopeptide (TPR) repeat protein
MTSSASGAAPASRPALGLWICLAALALLRLVFAWDPTMWAWGLSLLRFVEPIAGWALWLLSALALIPPLARAALPWARRAGESLAAGGPGAYVLAAIVALMLSLQPDRLHLVGDFLLRSGTAERALHPDKLYPQALPLDVLLHYDLPRALADAARIPVDATARVLGALEGGALALLAVSIARTLEADGATTLAVTLVALAGGFLGLFTGYGKAVAELVLLSFGVAAAAIRVTRGDRPAGWSLALCVALGLFLHRSALALLPAAAYAWWRGWRNAPEARRPAALLPIALALAVVGLMLPRVVATMLRWDPVHFAPPQVTQQGGMLRAALQPLHLIDLAQVLGLMSPLLPAGLWLAVSGERGAAKELGWIVLLVTLPWWPLLPLLHPPQGTFRDWDDFAPAGATLSLWTAARLGLALRARPRWQWLGVAAALGAMAPAEQWLAHQLDLRRGLDRVQAYLAGPPARPAAELGLTWDWLGIRAAQLSRWDLAAQSLSRAAETTPSPRVLSEWGLAERERGNEGHAQELFRRVTVLTPDDPNAWYRLAASSWRLGDYDECLRATLQLQRLKPDDETVTHMLDDLERVKPLHEPPR